MERHSSAAPAGVSGFSQPFDAAGRHRPLSPRRRAEARRAGISLLSLEELGDAVGGEADEALDARLLAESIERYLRTLSPRERGVFLARYFYVDPLADVARQYGTSIGAVKSLLYRTRQGLRAHLEQEGFTV